ncbi:MAG: molybdopterin-dependent oxidoreductase [Syntrophobacteraceae bacterium]
MSSIITTCALDCPDNCGMIAEVKEGRLTRLRGNPDHGYTRGYLCRKGYRYPARVYSEKRILHPLRKVDGQWRRISWDEALDVIAEKIRFFRETYGDASIMHYQRSASWGATKHLVKRFFNLLGDVTMQTGSLCAGSVMAAQKADMGARLGNDPEEFLNSRAILIWGKDPCKSSLHVVPILREAQKKGARIALIDPLRTKSASIADMHAAPRPGSDGYLAMGIAKEMVGMGLIDREFLDQHTAGYESYLSLIDSFTQEEITRACDVTLDAIQQLARLYGQAKPASILLGYGINKWVHSVEMIRLIDALGALTGNIGRAGGGVNHGFNTRRHFDVSVMAPAARKHRTIAEPLLGPGILESKDPAVRMIWINGTNPMVSCPDSNTVSRALMGLDFRVVIDHFMTDTAELADIFLPATTFVEEDDILVSWGHNWIGPVNKAIEPLGEAKSDLGIVQELAGRMGLSHEMDGSAIQWLKKLMSPMEKAGLTVDRVMSSPVRCPSAPRVAFQDGAFTTPSKKFEFIGEYKGEGVGPRPFHLLTVLSSHWLNSLILEDEHPDTPVALIHPLAAKARGIADKSSVLIRTAAGELSAEARLTEAIRQDAIAIEQGTWIKCGGGVNLLTECLMSGKGEMAGFYSTTADVEKA